MPMMIPQKKLATVIVSGLRDKNSSSSFVETLDGKKKAVSYKSNEEPESDYSAAKRDAAERAIRAFKAEDAQSLSDALTDFNALCSHGDEDESDDDLQGGSKVSDANQTVKQGF